MILNLLKFIEFIDIEFIENFHLAEILSLFQQEKQELASVLRNPRKFSAPTE